jgi:hypothetical protein
MDRRFRIVEDPAGDLSSRDLLGASVNLREAAEMGVASARNVRRAINAHDVERYG